MKKLIVSVTVLLIAVHGFSQKDKINDKKHKSNNVLVTESYTCPMHPDVKSNKPGKCSQCGMDLKLSKKEQLKKEVTKTYSCSMHPEVVSDTAGTCSKCGMTLNLTPKEKLKMGVVKNYACPMHDDVKNDKPGKCPKCGMKLEKTKTKSKTGSE